MKCIGESYTRFLYALWRLRGVIPDSDSVDITDPVVDSLGDSILSHHAIYTTLAILKSIVGLNFNILQACTLI